MDRNNMNRKDKVKNVNVVFTVSLIQKFFKFGYQLIQFLIQVLIHIQIILVFLAGFILRTLNPGILIRTEKLATFDGDHSIQA